MLEPLRQDQDYHRFADGRAFFGVENAADVLSNVALVVVGGMGLWFLWRNRNRSTEMQAYWGFFCAVTLAGIGSAYYHLAPDDARLAWDRLPIALAFMCLLAAVIGERLSVKAGARLLVPLIVIGAASVLYWRTFNDLRPYVLVQFGAIVVILGLGALYPSRYTKGEMLFVAAAIYGVAKFFELKDRQTYELLNGWVSGHTLKHLTAAAALYVILWSLQRRAAQPAIVRPPDTLIT